MNHDPNDVYVMKSKSESKTSSEVVGPDNLIYFLLLFYFHSRLDEFSHSRTRVIFGMEQKKLF